jgi:hypothetical protein
MDDKLIFVIGSPRSGTTMLQRMLGSHSQIHTHPEPHLMTPLAHLGYYHSVDKAPFDHINAAKAMREFVDELPGGEKDYLRALRAFCDVLYGQMLETTDKTRFLDKTPAYALVADFVARVYPSASYISLTRHPLAILSSYANSFFGGDYRAAYDFNPILDRYVPAIADFIRNTEAPNIHVRYEDLVADPEGGMQTLCSHMGLEFEPEAVDYGKHQHIKKSFGDPNVDAQSRPVTSSVAKWATELATDGEKLRFAQGIVEGLDPKDLETWGYPKANFWAALDEVEGAAPAKERVNAYRMQRKLLLKMRRTISDNDRVGDVVRGVRYYCNVLLRES